MSLKTLPLIFILLISLPAFAFSTAGFKKKFEDLSSYGKLQQEINQVSEYLEESVPSVGPTCVSLGRLEANLINLSTLSEDLPESQKYEELSEKIFGLGTLSLSDYCGQSVGTPKDISGQDLKQGSLGELLSELNTELRQISKAVESL